MGDLQTPAWTEAETLQYWWSMRRAMESAGDRTSAIYHRSVAITEAKVSKIDTATCFWWEISRLCLRPHNETENASAAQLGMAP